MINVQNIYLFPKFIIKMPHTVLMVKIRHLRKKME